MYAGYLATGQGNPFEGGTWNEIINNGRAYAYACAAGLSWLNECVDCPETETVVPGAPDSGYILPTLDPAPWYDPNNPDSWGFLGVVGLEVTGDESSTRQATVTNSITGGGVIGPAYYGPRTLVVRALLIAEDECSLQFGINWMREVTAVVENPCGGDSLTFFDCCPCLCESDTPGGPCWVEVYRELRTDPDACDPDWWPTTYEELRVGPPEASEDWCIWIERYWQLANEGPLRWACCVQSCVFPYLRQYHNVMVIGGPVVLSHPSMHTTGAMAEIELTIAVADPTEYALAGVVGASTVIGGVPLPGSGPFAVGAGVNTFDTNPPDPFAEGGRLPFASKQRPRVPEPKDGWLRHTQQASAGAHGNLLSGQRLSFRLRNGAAPADRVRIGVWRAGERVGGYLVPHIPSNATITIDGARRVVEAEFDTRRRQLSGHVKDWDGGGARYATLPHGPYQITVDQESGKEVSLVVAVSSTPVATP